MPVQGPTSGAGRDDVMNDSKRRFSRMWVVACTAMLILSILLVCGCVTTQTPSSDQSTASTTVHQATSTASTTVAAANTTAKAGTHDLTVYAAASLSTASTTVHQATSTASTPVAAANTTAKAGTHDLTVYAAASLTDASKTLGTTFEQSHPGVSVKFNLAAPMSSSPQGPLT